MTDVLQSLGWRDLGVVVLIGIVVLQHAGTAGIHAAMGRDGRVYHRGIEAKGALRGVVALVALVAPVALVAALDALSSPARFDHYVCAGEAMLWWWFPITILALASFSIARLSPWQVRSSVNSMVFSSLELFRPAVAAVGVAVAAFTVADARVTFAVAFAVIASLQVERVTRRWWYSQPITLDDLGAPVARTMEAP